MTATPPVATLSKLKNLHAKTLFRWEAPASPHSASMLEGRPCSDIEVLNSLQSLLCEISCASSSDGGGDAVAVSPSTVSSSLSSSSSVTYIETAGGVLSPSAASPENTGPHHARSSLASDNSHKPNWGWTLQGDLYQPLIGHAPVVLVGDGRLGGISCTLSALESLILRGYDVAALILLEPENGRTIGGSSNSNVMALRDYISNRRAFQVRAGSGEVLFQNPLQSILSLPPIPSDPSVPLYDWFDSDAVVNTFAKLDSFLQNSWEGQVADMRTMVLAGNGRDNAVWWPDVFANAPDAASTNSTPSHRIPLVDSAVGRDCFVVRIPSSNEGNVSENSAMEKRPFVDASAASWTQGVGYGESSLALSAAAAAGRYGHVSGGIMHAPAVSLAQTLVGPTGPGAKWASRVFFTDGGGSLAIETAIKMGIKTYQKRMRLSLEKAEATCWILCTQEDCYHGDTLGVMNAAEAYTDKEHPWYELKSLCLSTPTIGYRDGVLTISFPEGLQPSADVAYTFSSIDKIMDIRARSLSKLLSLYKEMIEMQWLVHEHRSFQKIGSVLLEPILQCSGGMKFIDPLWQRAMIDVAESRSIPVIFDESSTGLRRLGIKGCHSILKKEPDIAVYSKLLTGGVIPLSVTLTTEEVYDSFSTDPVQQRLLNGNSYVANPSACNAALHTLSAYDSVWKDEEASRRNGPWLLFDEDSCRRLSQLSCVDQSFTLGTVLVVSLSRSEDANVAHRRVEQVVARLLNSGILVERNGLVIYIMTSPFTQRSVCVWLVDQLYAALVSLDD